MDKQDVVYTYNRTVFIHKKNNETLPFSMTWMELESIMLSGIREKQILYDFTHMWNFRNKTNDQRKKREREANQETDS